MMQAQYNLASACIEDALMLDPWKADILHLKAEVCGATPSDGTHEALCLRTLEWSSSQGGWLALPDAFINPNIMQPGFGWFSQRRLHTFISPRHTPWCHTVMMSYYHDVILLWCHTIMLSYWHDVIPSWCHTVMMSYCLPVSSCR